MRIIEVIGNSMEPSLKEGQFVLTKGISYPIKRNQIVLVAYNDKLLIKRVMGLPGEIIQIKGSNILVNDDILKPFSSSINHIWELDVDQFVLLGDNASNSLDSRKFGEIDSKQLIARIIFKLWPFGRVT